MAKTKSAFFCQSCGAQAAKWSGKCNACGEWNTLVEEVIEKEASKKITWEPKSTKGVKTVAKPLQIKDIEVKDERRVPTTDQEFNRVLGGGIVPGSITLIGGEPGIGKSTLLLQIALSLSHLKVLYVSGEESQQQIKMRAERMGKAADNTFILSETVTHNIFSQIKAIDPEIVIIDSIQTLYSEQIDAAAGSVSQVKQCASELQRFAKESNVPVFMIGHINKEGSIAGPKLLEHIVDAVLQFEGDRNYAYRIIRNIKNRFGSTQEIGIYEMLETGLREVSNPSEILITERESTLSGIAIAATIEGARPLLIETQALVTPAVYGQPQRSATGYDLRRLGMLLAVLEKRCGFKFGMSDVFLNIAGGVKIDDPAIDLSIIVALLSSFDDLSVSDRYVFAGEVGLSGEIRAVSRVDQRIAEAEKLGFDKIFISTYNKKSFANKKFKIEVVMVSKIEDLYQILFNS